MSDGNSYVRNSEHLVAELGGEAVVLHASTGRYYGLNASGMLLWGLLEKPQKVGDMSEALVAAFKVSPDIAEHDVAEWIGLLLDAGLIRQVL